MDVNFFGQIAVTQAFMPLVRQATGRIINVASILGRIVVPFSGPYCASKFAMEAITDALRMELMPDGIHVVAIQPTIIGTGIWAKQHAWQDEMMSELPPEARQKYEQRLQILSQSTTDQQHLSAPPDIIAQAIDHAMTSATPKTRYTVGPDKAGLLLMAHFVPDRLRDQILMRRINLWNV